MNAPASFLQRDDEATLDRLARMRGDHVLEELGTGSAGLTWHEAGKRLAQVGPNTIADVARRGALRHFASHLASPLSLVLLALAAVNFATGQLWGAIVIAVMVVLATLLSFVQEYRSDRAAERLRAMVHTTARVLRRNGNGHHDADLPVAQLVPGDVITLAAGDAIPADLRILTARDLFVDQSTLTGESMPVEKSAPPLDTVPASPLDLANIAFMGSSVISGSATAVVVATGARTDFGKIAATAAGARELTSFDRGVNRYVWFMVRVMLVLVPLVFLVNGLTKGDWLQALLFAIAVAVGLTPELLPMVVTINLAKGALAMAERKVIVKRLNAIQNVGAMDVLCTDKTGTLTQNRVILEKHVDIDGRDSARVTEFAYLNSHFQTGLRNLLDEAVINYAHAHQLQPVLDYRKIDELPFDFERRRLSVILERPDGTRLLICKGAVEEVVAVCANAQQHGATLGPVVQGLNEEGFRVIAVATRELPAGAAQFSNADERELVLAGYIAFLDPPKSSAQEAIHALRQRGVAVKVLTGDNEAVTRHVARHVGLADSAVLHGADIVRMDAATLDARVQDATLFVKLTPQQKMDVIRALQRNGHVVGYLGDGINDSAALKAADVGISVDSGVDIAKESADIILLKKSLMAVSDGVHEGRRVFGNISKYLRMSASSNFGNVLSVLGASALLPFLPMAPVQILLNNLLYDVSQTALASDHVDADDLARPRRWDVADIGRAMLTLGPVSSLFDYLTFAVLWFGLGADAHTFQTGWFLESLLSQTLVVHIIRTGKLPFIESAPSPLLLTTTVAVCLSGLWLPASPLAGALGFAPMPLTWWIVLPPLLAGYLACAQLAKGFIRGAAQSGSAHRDRP